MMFQMAVPCLALSQWQTLLIWAAVIGVAVLAGRALARLSARMKHAIVLPVLVVGLLLGGSVPAFATVPGGGCVWMNEQQWPCWIIEAFWCPCTWDDDAGGGGSGAGDNLPN